jgi:hypothetical protein
VDIAIDNTTLSWLPMYFGVWRRVFY